MNEIGHRIVESWKDGGWTMIPIALVALGLYSGAIRVLSELSRRGFRKLSEPVLQQMVDRPETAAGNLGEIVRYTQEEVTSLDEIANRFSEVTAAEIPHIDRRVTWINVLVAAAPLLGLLGTVLGMLVTFNAIAAGGSSMVDAMAGGISEALITTEMGLLVALPGMILVYLVRRRRNEYAGVLATLESMTLRKHRQNFHGMTGYYVRAPGSRAYPASQSQAGAAR
jgi:biopolymer transport protein ExbB